MEQPTDQKPPPTIQPLKLAEVSEPAVKGQTPRSRSRAGHSRETGISPRNSISLYNTFNEAELSEYLVYITCPICEEVVSNDPVFTPCHHTFCGDCIRQHLLDGNRSCPECGASVQLGQLETNKMAINLLNSFKTRCIYQANGCKWKGKMRDLTSHYKSCSFAISECPNPGCSAKLDQDSLRQHMKKCEYRPVSDCVCRKTFAFNEREKHESECLEFLKRRLPAIRKELAECQASMQEQKASVDRFRLQHAQANSQAAGWVASGMILLLAIIAMFGQLLRPDATLSLAIYMLVAVQTRLPDMLAPFTTLLVSSLLCDLAWLALIGPLRLLLPELHLSVEDSVEEGCESDSLRRLMPMGRLAYVCVIVALKLCFLIAQQPLMGAYRALHGTIAKNRAETSPISTDIPLRRFERGGGGEVRGVEGGKGSGSAGEGKGAGVETVSSDCVSSFIQLIGKMLLIASFFSCICRPDAGAMLGLLVLTALRESRLYFSRVAFGATIITLALDWLWLHKQALPMENSYSILTNLLSLSGKVDVINQLDTQLQLALMTTLVTLPLKLLLLLLIVHTLCLPHVAEHRHFRFDQLDENTAVESVLDESSVPTMRIYVKDTSSLSTRAARRRERDIESLLAEAKRVVTLCFIGLLLTLSVASMGLLSSMGPMEPLVLTMLAAYGSLRHSNLCDSQPERCCALVDKTCGVLLPTAVTVALRLASSAYVHMTWSSVALSERIALVAMVASVVLVLLLIGSLLRLRWFLRSLHQVARTARYQQLSSRLRWISLVGFGLSCVLAAGTAGVDVAVFAMASFVLSADIEAEARGLLANVKRAEQFDRESLKEHPDIQRRLEVSCLAPDVRRLPGGLVSVVMLTGITLVTDVLWIVSFRIRQMDDPFEIPLVLLRLVIKMCFIATFTQLRLLGPQPHLAEVASPRPDVGGGRVGALFVSGCALLLLSCLSDMAVRLLAPSPRASASVADLLLDSQAGSRLSAGPVGVLGVLACAVALRSGGTFLPGLLSTTSFGTFIVGSVWLHVGPPQLGSDMLRPVLEGEFPKSLEQLSPLLQVTTLLLLLQLLLVLCICIATWYMWMSDRCTTGSSKQAQRLM